MEELLSRLTSGTGDLQRRRLVVVVGIPAPQPQHHRGVAPAEQQHRAGQAGEVFALTDGHGAVVDRADAVVGVGQQLGEVPIEAADTGDTDDREGAVLFLDAVQRKLDVRQFESRIGAKHDRQPGRADPQGLLDLTREGLVAVLGLGHDVAQELLEEPSELVDVGTVSRSVVVGPAIGGVGGNRRGGAAVRRPLRFGHGSLLADGGVTRAPRDDRTPGAAAPGPRGQTLKPSARSMSRPSSVILSRPHGGIHTQLMT